MVYDLDNMGNEVQTKLLKDAALVFTSYSFCFTLFCFCCKKFLKNLVVLVVRNHVLTPIKLFIKHLKDQSSIRDKI